MEEKQEKVMGKVKRIEGIGTVRSEGTLNTELLFKLLLRRLRAGSSNRERY